MDPDLNGKIDGVDIAYILYALAKKYRFLTTAPRPEDTACGGLIKVAFETELSVPVTNKATTKILLEIGTKQGMGGTTILSGANAKASPNGVVVQMSGPNSNGEFSAEFALQ